MKALTLWQPWAQLVACGAKEIETRCWTTKYRGELAIHSAAKLPPRWMGQSAQGEEFRNELADVFNCRRNAVSESVKLLPYGMVLCIVKLVAIDETRVVRDIISEQERIFGNYEDGRYAWHLEMVQQFDVAIPAKGNRLLWNWNEQGVA